MKLYPVLFLFITFFGRPHLKALERLKRDPFLLEAESTLKQRKCCFSLQGIARTNNAQAALISCNNKTYLVTAGDRWKHYYIKQITDGDVWLQDSSEDIILKLDQERK